MFCMQCGVQVPPETASCPSCGAQLAVERTATATLSPSTPAPGPYKKPANKVPWIIGGIALVLLICFYTANGSGGKLTTQKAQQAVSQWSGGGLIVTGVQELPQQNAATAAISFANFNVRQQGLFGMTSNRMYSGPGEATFTHFTDGRWVLVKVSTAEGFNSVWWDNLNIQVR